MTSLVSDKHLFPSSKKTLGFKYLGSVLSNLIYLQNTHAEYLATPQHLLYLHVSCMRCHDYCKRRQRYPRLKIFKEKQ